ncbi:MAG: hypothetical protein OEZ32_03500 [Nitrospinota bacterium]|nr:hypothetical protein [Nitrospinota bacterium]
MKLDEILQSAQRLPAPESLKGKVMAAVEADGTVSTGTAWMTRRAGFWRRRIFRPAMAMAACAAAILLTVWLAPGSVSTPPAPVGQESVALMEVDLLLEETLEKVYGFESIKDSAEYRMEEDEAGFINNNLEQIFRMNGGNNA